MTIDFDRLLDRIDKIEREYVTPAMVEGLHQAHLKMIEGLKATCEALLKRVERLESSGCHFTVPANPAVDPTPVHESIRAEGKQPAVTPSSPTVPIPCESVPQTPPSDLEQKSKSRILEQLWSLTEEAKSRGIGWISIRDMIRMRISEQENSVFDMPSAQS